MSLGHEQKEPPRRALVRSTLVEHRRRYSFAAVALGLHLAGSKIAPRRVLWERSRGLERVAHDYSRHEVLLRNRVERESSGAGPQPEQGMGASPREHSLLLFIGITGIGWTWLFLRMSPDSKWGQVVGNLVSEWGQMAGLVFLTKRLVEVGSKTQALGRAGGIGDPMSDDTNFGEKSAAAERRSFVGGR